VSFGAVHEFGRAYHVNKRHGIRTVVPDGMLQQGQASLALIGARHFEVLWRGLAWHIMQQGRPRFDECQSASTGLQDAPIRRASDRGHTCPSAYLTGTSRVKVAP
jgi:hypothetical protein